MKQRLFILLTFVVVLVVLVVLNAASYVQKDRTPDSEAMPNRSSFNTGATGTQALFTLLKETGRPVRRWQRGIESLADAADRPATFVMIGPLKREVTEAEATKVLEFVSDGGTLVLIDRDPPKELVTTTSSWKVWLSGNPAVELLSVDPLDIVQMTKGADAARFVQPTRFSRGVNAAQPSRFSSWVGFERYDEEYDLGTGYRAPAASSLPDDLKGPVAPPPVKRELLAAQDKRYGDDKGLYAAPTPADVASDPLPDAFEPTFDAPVVHLTSGEKNLLVDVPFGSGRIVYLADPYIVSNAGIALVDNARLATNILTAAGGPIAIDEYHHGYGADNNRFLEYFAGTPVIAIFMQLALLAALIMFSQSRRFARPLPDASPDRLSKLEYVSAMADMQRRLKAYDLAMENIFVDFRRRAARAVGLDNSTASRRQLAEAVAARIDGDAREIEHLMNSCESVMHGDRASADEVLGLTVRLREIETRLGIGQRLKYRL
ncbi:MAG: DUF4350 domain-containing protein [Pyrinomonadaceae bacterium]